MHCKEKCLLVSFILRIYWLFAKEIDRELHLEQEETWGCERTPSLWLTFKLECSTVVLLIFVSHITIGMVSHLLIIVFRNFLPTLHSKVCVGCLEGWGKITVKSSFL